MTMPLHRLDQRWDNRFQSLADTDLMAGEESLTEDVVKCGCDEGVAIHVGSEPCACLRADAGEESAGDGTNQPLSRENWNFLGADAIINAEGNTFGRAICK